MKRLVTALAMAAVFVVGACHDDDDGITTVTVIDTVVTFHTDTVYLIDSIYVPVHDTTYIAMFDTVFVTDTVLVPVVDTVLVERRVTDTIYIVDTVRLEPPFGKAKGHKGS
jgi:hypothetical protein